MSNAFVAPHFASHEAARDWLENLRWPEGPICCHCGTINHAYKTKKPGWYRCAEKECRKDFTVTTGTVMERSHIPLNKWLMAFYLLNASKKGMSAHQLHRALNLDYKSAWFMCHRIREAMRTGGFGPLGWRRQDRRSRRNLLRPDREGQGRTKTTSGRPSQEWRTRPAPTSAQSSPWWSVAATSARSMSRSPTRKRRPRSCAKTSLASRGCTPTKAALYLKSADYLLSHETVKHALANTSVMTMAKPSTPIQRKAISRSSSAECAASISTAKRSICTVILPSSITATITAWRSATATSTAPLPRSEALKASG